MRLSHDENRLSPGRKQLHAYELVRLLDHGGMGEVYQAEHRLLKRPCAVKCIQAARTRDPQYRAWFEREVQAMAKLSHPHTVRIFDYGVADGTPFYAMEFLPGLNLQQIVDRSGPMQPARAIHLLGQVCSALVEAHGHGLVHRDLKPANLFATAAGGDHDFVKVIDFGLVLDAGAPVEQFSREALVVGSPHFAAPEMTLGEHAVGPRTDIYSLGATAYCLLTGRPVFERSNPMQVMLAHLRDTPTPPSQLVAGISPELEATVLRCLEKDPADRYAAVEDLAAALLACSEAGSWTAECAQQWWANHGDFASGSAPADGDATTVIRLHPATPGHTGG